MRNLADKWTEKKISSYPTLYVYTSSIAAPQIGKVIIEIETN